jgi:hypothetical protein
MLFDELGYFRDYGNYILSICLILYGFLFSFLSQEYGDL